jgi:hypothetical protein
MTVEQLQWCVGALPESAPTRKGELVALLARVLGDEARIRVLFSQLTSVQQRVLAEIAHSQSGRYDAEVIEAKYPGSKAPKNPRMFGYSLYGFGSQKKEQATPFDLFFFYNYDVGPYIPPDLAERLRAIVPAPPPTELKTQASPPILHAARKGHSTPPEVLASEAERAIFHDIGATLYLAQQGKISVSPATSLPTLPALRLLRQQLLVGDYFADDYERAEEAIRPLALVVLVQAARWAAPAPGGNKLELTRAGQALIGAQLGPQQIREAWERWLKSDLLDELSRVRSIKGQQAKGTRLTKPATRRIQLAEVLHRCPTDRWVKMDELLRYMRAERLLPAIERGTPALSVGSYTYYEDSWSYSSAKYWDVVIGSYLRATLWEYAATLGIIEIAYTRPEETPHDFGHLYGLDGDVLSRYDGLLAIRLTSLGAYALGLTDEYTPPPVVVVSEAPILKVLPNLDVVITDAERALPNDRVFLERIAEEQSQNVYRLSRDQLLEAASGGLDLRQVREFLVAKSGQAEAEFPQIVRVFFEDLEKRLNALREAGRMVVIEGDDNYLLTELSNNPALRALAQLGSIGGRTVLLVPEEQETAARRQLKKLGYIPRKG